MSSVVQRAAGRLAEERPYTVATRVWRHLKSHVAARSAILALGAGDRRAETLDEAVELAFAFEHRGIRIAPYQVRSEIRRLLGILERRRPRTILQIGTCTGGTLYLLARVAAPDALLVSVDLYRGRFGGGYSPWYAPLYRSFARRQQRIDLVLGDSHDASTVEQVRRRLQGRPVDFLFIDGDHSYEGVASDYRLYAPLVAADGSIAFHDIVPGLEENVGGVPRFWHEVDGTNAVRSELVEDWGQGSAGIGLLEKLPLPAS